MLCFSNFKYTQHSSTIITLIGDFYDVMAGVMFLACWAARSMEDKYYFYITQAIEKNRAPYYVLMLLHSRSRLASIEYREKRPIY